MPVPFKVKAVYDYQSEEPDDLTFKNGQVITVIEEDDPDWYTGEYNDTTGHRLEGIFPRNFVEKYEPAIPSRPTRPPRREAQPEPEAIGLPSTAPSLQAAVEAPVELTKDSARPQSSEEPKTAPQQEPKPVSRTPSLSTETKPAAAKPPPPVVDKPSSNSFRDRIAAFNKSAAAPITPFKPGGSGGAGFVKKPFVAPPPSRNSYVPPPAQPAPQKVYRREEETSRREDEEEAPQDDTTRSEMADTDQPKPASLKDRIALLQQQQLEQAAKSAEKKKVKKPIPQRSESTENVQQIEEPASAPLTRQETGDTLGKRSVDTSRVEELESLDDARSTYDETTMPTVIPPPSRELVSDTNDADDSGAGDTEDALEASAEEEQRPVTKVKSPPQHSEQVENDQAEEAEEDEQTEDEDPEVRRRRELRERMAKMSGGMGMMGMFGGGMPAPSKKANTTRESDYSAEPSAPEETQRAPPVPIMALPGMAVRPRQPEPEVEDDEQGDTPELTPPEPIRQDTADDEDYITQPTRTSTGRSVARSPDEYAHALPSQKETRAVPPPPSAPSIPGLSQAPQTRSVPVPPPNTRTESFQSYESSPRSPPVPARSSLDRQPSTKVSLPSGVPPPIPGRSSIEGASEGITSSSDKRLSRAPPPPVPGTAPTSSQVRAPPPPPPPGQPPTRRTTNDSQGFSSPREASDDSEAEITEYDGDYDTDIASSAKHKDALKSHNRDSSIDDEGTFTDDATAQVTSPPSRAVPPLPPTAPPRDVPPPPPPTAAKSRRSIDVPRSLPPPIPVTRPEEDVEYDPYRYSSSPRGLPTPPAIPLHSPPLRALVAEVEEEDMYGTPLSPPSRVAPIMSGALPVASNDRAAPPPPPRVERPAPIPPQTGSLPAAPNTVPVATAPPLSRQSLDVNRQSTVRRSMDVTRPSGDYGFMATDIDLAEASGWWTQENTPPPSLQARNDVLFEVESSTSTKRGGRTAITRDVYVLYMDHSQTTINVAFDTADPSRPLTLQQTHERPPPPPRQDQLESASDAFGSHIARAAGSASGNIVGDGSPHALVTELLQPFRSTALMPVGTRSYGALVYANLANASTQQFDEIRPGDIVTFRNTKFAGHKGGLHAKYSMEVGKPDHVGIVIDWDGTKKKIRAYEQGREEKGKKTKTREESFRVGDLKSGELRVWRVMPRSWVGWDKS